MKPGDQLASTTSTTRVVIVRIPTGAQPLLTCGGQPLVLASTRPAPAADPDPVTLIGKRYVDATGELELLCTYSGQGELFCDGNPMTLKTAKALPASD